MCCLDRSVLDLLQPASHATQFTTSRIYKILYKRQWGKVGSGGGRRRRRISSDRRPLLPPLWPAGDGRPGGCVPPQDLLNHPTTPRVLSACKLAEPQTVQDGTPAAACALANALLARPHAPSHLAQKLAPFRPMVERSVEQSVPPAESGPRNFATARLSMAPMHASAAAGVVKGEVVHRKNFVEVDAMPRLNPCTSF
jgi:hypothetical protein